MEIAITSLGLITPLGHKLDTVFAALRRGETALRPWSEESGQTFYAGRIVDFNPRDFLKQKGLAALSRSSLLCAASLALLGEGRGEPLSSSASSDSEAMKTALVVGTAFGHLDSKYRFCEEAGKTGVQLVSPILFPNTILNALGGHAAILNGWRGPNSTLSSGRTSGLEALRYARELLESGRAERAVAAGCDEVSAPLLLGLRAKNLLATADPAGPNASLPFQPQPGGFYLGEAAVALLLEKLSPGQAALSRIAGCGFQSGVRRGLKEAVRGAIVQALDQARLSAADLGVVALSGSGSPEDDAEAAVLEELLAGKVPAFAPKRALGESFGAAGLLNVALASACLRESIAPPTPGVRSSRKLGLSQTAVPLNRRNALVLAVDPGGASAAVLRGFSTI